MAGIRKFNHIKPERVIAAILIGVAMNVLISYLIQGETLLMAIGGGIFVGSLSLVFTPTNPPAQLSRLGIILTDRTVEGPVIGPRANWWQKRSIKLKRRVVPYRMVDLLGSDLVWQKKKDNYLLLKNRERLVLNRILISKEEFDEIIAAIADAQRRRMA